MTRLVPGKLILNRNSLQTCEEGVIVQAVEIITGVGGLKTKHNRLVNITIISGLHCQEVTLREKSFY